MSLIIRTILLFVFVILVVNSPSGEVDKLTKIKNGYVIEGRYIRKKVVFGKFPPPYGIEKSKEGYIITTQTSKVIIRRKHYESNSRSKR